MELVIRNATRDDAPRILELMRQYYSEDGYPFSTERAARAISDFLENPSLGRLWVMAAGDRIVGYVVLTLGFSFEYQGRDAFLDELYIEQEWRGKGLGKRSLELVENTCRQLGVNALHLEVETDKNEAYRLYTKAGFRGNDRHLMTKRLTPAPQDQGS